MQIKKIDEKINMDEQFDVELQNWLTSYFCDVDCGQQFHNKGKSQTLDCYSQLASQGGVFKNPTQKQRAKDRELCAEAGMTFCYVTGTKKTTGLW
jgi:hypothetical protein